MPWFQAPTRLRFTNDMGCQTIDTNDIDQPGQRYSLCHTNSNLTSCTEANGMISLDTTSNTHKNKHPLVNRRKYYPTQLSKGRHLLLHLTDAAIVL